jgi:hypothetical protein
MKVKSGFFMTRAIMNSQKPMIAKDPSTKTSGIALSYMPNSKRTV